MKQSGYFVNILKWNLAECGDRKNLYSQKEYPHLMENMRSLEESGEKALGIIQSDKTQDTEMKEKLQVVHFLRMRTILRSGLIAGNVISASNSRTGSIIRYGTGIRIWSNCDLLVQKPGKMLTIYRRVNPRTGVDRLYRKKERERGLETEGLLMAAQDQALRMN